MIKFSLLGETILEWNDKDIEHYHARRMAMDSMLCRFKATYPAERIDSVRSLLEDKERQMFQIVRLMDEHVTNYHKAVTDQYIYDIPCIFRCSSDGNTFFYSTWGSQKDVLKMEFVVDSLGNCKLYWGIPNNQTPTFYRQQVEAQYGGLVKKDVTRTYKISAAKAGLWFTSAEQIQSLIDALDPKALEKECKALYEEKNRKDNRDELFK